MTPGRPTIKKAFVLAAGLGTRLRPLTEFLPKPLIPVGLKPLITFAFDHLIADLGVQELIANTHHCASAFGEIFPDSVYRGLPLHLRHEPDLLDSAGGIRNIADLLDPADGTILVYNGDNLTDQPLGPALAHHRAAGNEVTLVLRSVDGPKHVAWDPGSGRILDIRNRLGTGHLCAYALSCGYFIEPEFLNRIMPGQPSSVVPIFLEMIRRGERIGGALANDGEWRELGTVAEYLGAHRELFAVRETSEFPRYAAGSRAWLDWIDPTAQIAAGVELHGACVIGPGARVSEGAVLRDTILWRDAEIASGARLDACIVRSSMTASGTAADRVF